MHRTIHIAPACRLLTLLLMLALLSGCFTSCAGNSEIPDGYQYATCAGEYFRFFVPTQWTVNTEGGVSGAYLSVDTSVTMAEIPFHGDFTDEQGQPRTATLEDFYLAHLEDLSSLRGFSVGEDDMHYSTMGSYKAVNITYNATVAETAYRFRQVLCRVEGRFYLFTYSAPRDSFDTYQDIVDEIIENIAFYNTPYEGSGDTKKVSDRVTPPAGMKLVSTDKVAYRFFVPAAWESDMEMSVDLVYVTEPDGSRSNVTMMSYMPEDEGFSVADYWEMCQMHYQDALPAFEVTSVTQDQKIGDRNAVVYEYTYTLSGVTYKVRQAICVYSTMVYTLTYTALEEHYEAHLEDVNAMQAAVVFRSPFKKA